MEKVEKLVGNLHDKKEYVIHIRNLKQALNHGLVLKKVHRINKFNEKAWLDPYINMNTDIGKKAKNNLPLVCLHDVGQERCSDVSKVPNHDVYLVRL